LNSTLDEIWRRGKRPCFSELDFEHTRRATLDGVNVGEAAATVCLSTHTLRWYEQVGLLDPIERDSAGRRRYGDADLNRLRFLVRLRSTGMPVRDMIRYIELVRLGPASYEERVELLRAHRDRVLSKISALGEDLKIIEYKIDLYEGAGSGGRVGTEFGHDDVAQSPLIKRP
jgi:DNA-binding transcriptional MerR regulator